MENKNKLKIMLKDIIKIIEGPWFVADGALLGLMREGDLLEFDSDIDIYILPETKINWDKLDNKYNFHKDYMCYKIYNGEDKIPTENEWIRFIAFKRTLPEFYGYSRAELTEAVATDYKSEKIIRQYPNLWVDIISLVYDNKHDLYRLPYHWNGQEFYFTPDECKGMYDNRLGFDIKIPKNPKQVLERIYGTNWLIEQRDHVY
tara:strand:- start:9 stop:617 length:609 start_codon:yes stop_codon:yes gene_type:complete